MPRSIVDVMADAGVEMDELIARSGIDARTVRAIACGQYTPSPSQRDRLATALGVDKHVIAWGHSVPVQHLRGNGPQFGRST